MPGRRRSKAEIARDRRRIGDLYLKGWLQADIATEVGVSQPTVSLDLKALHAEWLKSTLIDINEARSRELAKLDQLEREYWKGWLRSCMDAEEEIVKVTIDEQGIKTEETKKVKGQSGDTKFLDGIQKCVAQRCKILGVEAPEEHTYDIGPQLIQALEALPGEFKMQVMAQLTNQLESGEE